MSSGSAQALGPVSPAPVSPAPISLILPTYRRPKQLLDTLARVRACTPPPAEIVVHVDGGDTPSAVALRPAAGADLKVLVSQGLQGPGGGRNRAVAAASHELIVSLDDDSYPLDPDFFARVVTLFDRQPAAALVGAAVFYRGESPRDGSEEVRLAADFASCGCAFRRDAFLATRGFQALPIAYGMQETDLALQLHDQGAGVLACDWLRVHHDRDRVPRPSAEVAAARIRNAALLAWLRYPSGGLPMGLREVLARIVWGIRHGQVAGVAGGIVSIVPALMRHGRARAAVRLETLHRYQRLRHPPAHGPGGVA